ncbi:MAG: ABC transporter permease [Candidatus Aminicenantes bacterium]|nr:MAG: ABC transporter permease [Candidatus Aminicenantes bacterium]
MFKNHLKIAFRNVGRNKAYSFINISGLAIGMACCILILLWVQDELSYDRFHEKADRIHRVVFSSSDENTLPTNANGSFGVGPALKRDFPEIIETVRIRKMGIGVKVYIGHKDKKFYEERFFFAEPSIFTVFDFPLIQGDPATALNEPNTIVLSREMAEKYFGDEDPLGQTVEADPYNDGEIMQFRITGIVQNVPRNSHIHFNFLASYISQKDDTNDFSGFWQHYTYVLLDQNTSAESLNPKFLAFLHRHWKKDPWYTISLQPLLDIHLHSRLRSEVEPTGNILYVYVFTAIAVFVLVIACINFMNLTTARSIKRAKEVGIRKVVGAQKNQLIRQFLGESLLLSVLSALMAICIVMMTLPLFNRIAVKDISLNSIINPWLILGMIAIALAVGILAGIYPAFVLSSFQPMHSLKSRMVHSFSGVLLRKGLVIFQFTLSIGIIFATLIAHKQMFYIQSRNLGYDKEQIIVIRLNKDLRKNYEAFRNELLTNPGIENSTTSSYVPTRGSGHLSLQFEGRDDPLSQVIYFVDEEFIRTYGIKLLAGKNIRLSIPEEGASEFLAAGKDIDLPVSEESLSEFLVSERTVQEAGYSSPLEAVGKGAVFVSRFKGHIVGVVSDINIYSLHRQPYSITYMITPIQYHNYLSIRILPRNISEAIDYIGKTWKKIIPNYPLDYFFLDASFEQMHLADKKLGEIFSVFSVLAILVACMGLFGLATYTGEQKTKEIGIRKVLGASTFNIYLLLSRDFLKWVALANILAWPVAYYAMHRWLQSFAFRASIGWEIFCSLRAWLWSFRCLLFLINPSDPPWPTRSTPFGMNNYIMSSSSGSQR